MADRKYYVLCDQNCKFESMTKEQILTAIEQAVTEGEIKDIDSGFITTIKTINNVSVRFFAGSQSEYEALTDAEKENLFALITNDTTEESILAAIEEVRSNTSALELWKTSVMGGETAVPEAINAGHASTADDAEHAITTDSATAIKAQTLKTFPSFQYSIDGLDSAGTLLYSNGSPLGKGMYIFLACSNAGNQFTGFFIKRDEGYISLEIPLWNATVRFSMSESGDIKGHPATASTTGTKIYLDAILFIPFS